MRVLHIRLDIYKVLFALHVVCTVFPVGSFGELAFQRFHGKSLALLVARTYIGAITTTEAVENIDLNTESHTVEHFAHRLD